MTGSPSAAREIHLVGAATLAEGQTQTFAFERKKYPVQGFLIRYHGELLAYLNMCQHWPIPLDMGDEDFFYSDIDRIRCKTHGATYDPGTGLCDTGPCVGGQLIGYPVRIEGQDIWVTVSDA